MAYLTLISILLYLYARLWTASLSVLENLPINHLVKAQHFVPPTLHDVYAAIDPVQPLLSQKMAVRPIHARRPRDV